MVSRAKLTAKKIGKSVYMLNGFRIRKIETGGLREWMAIYRGDKFIYRQLIQTPKLTNWTISKDNKLIDSTLTLKRARQIVRNIQEKMLVT